MDTGGWIQRCLLLFICVCVVSGNSLGSTTIKCDSPSNPIELGEVEEGYTGDIEVVNGIPKGTGVTLVERYFPSHLEFLELNFTLGDTSATVRTKKPLDVDTLGNTGSTLFYSIVCDGMDKNVNERSLKVKDINDNGPIFEKKLYNTTVSEMTAVKSEVLRVTAVDADSSPENNKLTYSFVPASEDFQLTNAGAFNLMRRLNYNMVKQYNFTVTAMDDGGLNDTANVIIYVEDIDNFNPYFSHSVYQAFTLENQIGHFRAIEPEAIKAQDGDTGIDMTLNYSISEVVPQKYYKNFGINSSNGVLSVLTAIDREEMSISVGSNVISISIKASQTDDSMKTADAVVYVTVEDVNDNAPRFDQSIYHIPLQENSPVDAVVFQAIVHDMDEGGFDGTFRIIPESAPFSIGSDGVVRVKNSTALDRETAENIMFEIEAKENKEPKEADVAQVSVTLLDENDNGPIFTSDKYEGKVFANQTVGMVLVLVKAEDLDADENGKIVYSIEFGNSDGYFSINENTGEINLAKTIPLVENRILEFPLHILARDGGIISRSSSTLVNIRAPGNSNPQFLQKVYHGTIEEEQNPGVEIIQVDFLATPAEVPVTLQVESETDKFAISSTGEFTTKVKFDYDEAPRSYSVEISISDGVHKDTAVVEVQVTDVNDNSPVFTSSSVTKSVPEDTEVGSNVTAISATDKDSSFNKEIRYSLRGDEGRFFIDPVSGMVSVAGALDRETKAEYNLLVVAEDQGRPVNSATASLLVQISDVNDNIPKFSAAEYQVEVLETESVGKSLFSLSADDPDEGVNGKVTYSIFKQSPASDPAVFELDPDGTLRLVQSLDYSEVNVYSLMVQASDGGSPSLVGSGSVVVKVTDVNNNPPEFSQAIYYADVFENLASGASILTLEVTDRDEGGFSNGYFVYTSDTFEINKQGVVSLRRNVTLDRETKDSYILQVVGVDQVTDGLRSTAQLNITILDYNDNAPQFPAIPDPLQIPEGNYSEESPREVLAITPTDADLGLNGEVTLSLSSPHPLFRFREDGMLLAVGSLDRESRDTYDLVVKASDRGSPQRENIITIRVSLLDVNDNRPEFSSSSYDSSILLKDAEVGKVLLTLSATDRDSGNNALITYSFSGEGSPYLALNSETGAVTLTSDLADITEDTVLQLTAVAEDHGEPPLSSTAQVVVNLRVASLVEGVVFSSSSYNFSLPEDQLPGASVGKVSASSGSNLYDINYTLKTHTDLFSISANGTIITKTQLDKEVREWYILNVEAVDTRTPPTSAVTIVTVQVEDINEPPQFTQEVYEGSVFSIAPYKTPVIQVKASDPDVGEVGQLVYSMSAGSPYFDVEPSSGLVYVVSAVELAGFLAELEVKATDPRGLSATAKVKVVVKESESSSDVVVISINHPANTVEKKVQEMEKVLGDILEWTVTIIEVSSTNRGASETRALRVDAKTLVSFIAVDSADEIVPSEEVIEKLLSKSADVQAELAKLFQGDTDVDVETEPESPSSNQTVVIILAVLLALSILGLIVFLVFNIRLKRKEKVKEHKESLDRGRHDEGYTNWSRKLSVTSEQGKMKSQEIRAESERQWMDGPSKKNSMKINRDFLGHNENKEAVSSNSERDKQDRETVGKDAGELLTSSL